MQFGGFYDPVGKVQGCKLRLGEARLLGKVPNWPTLRLEPDCNLIWRNERGGWVCSSKCLSNC